MWMGWGAPVRAGTCPARALAGFLVLFFWRGWEWEGLGRGHEASGMGHQRWGGREFAGVARGQCSAVSRGGKREVWNVTKMAHGP